TAPLCGRRAPNTGTRRSLPVAFSSLCVMAPGVDNEALQQHLNRKANRVLFEQAGFFNQGLLAVLGRASRTNNARLGASNSVSELRNSDDGVPACTNLCRSTTVPHVWETRRMAGQRVTLTRKELYEQVWSEPMQILAHRYGMSDRGLAKNCAVM